ncbi:MAG: zinc-binding dehydrogenase [SAR202 cluster bacterium]|nr:zinc-binding dehydrogenase [SAR202 cluster bacterium]
MKAVYITEHGGTEVLTYGDLPEPVVGPNDVRIRVRACAINRLDVFTRAGVRGTRRSSSEPHILGGDVSGDIVEVGSEVSRVKSGDRVVVNPVLTCRQCTYCIGGQEELCVKPGMLGSTTNGGYAEYVTLPGVNTQPLPDSISYEQAASMPTVFLPCWSILMRRAALKPWETVLVLSASSGVGTAAIQVAKNVIGARVITTTSTEEKAEKARELGADEAINYAEEDVAKRVKELTGRGVDVVVDHVGADFWPAAMASLAPGGRYGICGVTSGYRAELQMGLMFLKHQTVLGVFMGRKEDLRQIVDRAAKGEIRGVVHETFPLEDAARAHETMESRNFFGKLVLTVP